MPRDHFLSNSLYNKLKFIAQIGLPAVGSLYFALAGIWDLPGAEQVLGTIVAIDTFLGVLLGLSTASYNASEAKYDGAMVITQTEGDKKTMSLELHKDPEEFEASKEVLFKVQSPQ